MTHYDTLQVVPWAEESVIRAAYRALMRHYHPDTNRDPEAELRAREITAAFVVLGDPAKRAAYDAFPTLGHEMDTKEPSSFAAALRTRWSMRGTGLASIGMAVIVLTLTVGMWPQLGLSPRQQLGAGATVRARVARGLKVLPTGKSWTIHDRSEEPSTLVAKRPVLLQAPARHGVLVRSNGQIVPPSDAEIARTTSSRSPGSTPLPTPATAEVPVPKAASAAESPSVISRSSAVASCPGVSPKVGAGECGVNRQAQVERIAAIFFKQSMDHADSHKQELLLSARTRSAFSRTLCRSSDCVTQTYLRQMRDTTEIMQGRVPTP